MPHESLTSRRIASGDGWSVSDIVCRSGPQDRPFEEQHTQISVAVVLSGTFQYRTAAGSELMTPGSLLLGNAGDCYCCGHEHGVGDRCVSFSYTPEFFERLAFDAGARSPRFGAPRLPPLRALAPLVAEASALLVMGREASGEELAMRVAAGAVQVAHGVHPRGLSADPGALARVTRVVRMIDGEPETPVDLDSLAAIARLSRFHFLRTFEGLTGTTPHQYVLRTRLRRAACRLRIEQTKVLDIALDCGFNDVANFNRTFRAEFGVTPRAFRRGDRAARVSKRLVGSRSNPPVLTARLPAAV